MDSQRISFRDTENLILSNDFADNTSIFWIFQKGQALSYFEYHLKRHKEAKDSKLLDIDFTELVIRYKGL
jgi:hypothetical protein